MSDIRIEKDMKLIKVLAAQAKGERVDSAVANEANEIINKIVAEDLNKESAHRIAETVAFTVNELQKNSLDFLNTVADQKTIGYGDKAAFNLRTGHVKAHVQAKGATTARSMVGSKQILVETKEIAARPAISILDVKANRVNVADLIREANNEMTNGKLKIIEAQLQSGMSNFGAPFYAAAASAGIDKTAFDKVHNTFKRLGPVTIMGDIAATSKLAPIVGMNLNATNPMFSDNMLDEMNNNAFLGRYLGSPVVTMPNGYNPELEGAGAARALVPTLDPDMLYFIVGAASADQRNLKVVNQGDVTTMEQQLIDDRTYDILLYQWFGAKYVPTEIPTIGGYKTL